MTVKDLAENYGSLDLLAAYIMRTAGVSEEQADEVVYTIDFDMDRYLDSVFDEDDSNISDEEDM